MFKKKFSYTPRDYTKSINIGVVGLGQKGAAIAIALRRANPYINIIGADSDADALEYAFAEGIIQLGNANLKILRGVGIIFVAVPAPDTPRVLNELYEVVRKEAILTDVSGVKEQILKEIPEGMRYVGGRPFVGDDRACVLAARADLYEGASYALITDRTSSGDYDEVAALVKLLGAKPFAVSARQHDYLASKAGCLPKISAAALITAAASDGTMAEIGGGDFFRNTAVASAAAADPRFVSAEIMTNRAAVLSDMDTLINELTAVKNYIKTDNAGGLTDYLNNASSIIRSYADEEGREILSVEIPVGSASLSALLKLLARRQIEIRDIYIPRQREGSLHNLRLVFRSPSDGAAAKELLTKKGYNVN